MAEAIHPAHDSELTKRFQRLQELLLWCEFAEKCVYPPEDSVIGLAVRLKIWQAVESQGFLLTEDLEDLPFYREIAREIKDRVMQASPELDHSFLRGLSDAAALAAKGEVSQPLDTTGTAVYAFRLLRDELGHRPSWPQVRKQVEQWRKEGSASKISDRQWERVRKEITPLFQRG
jgi:hypothetical protein